MKIIVDNVIKIINGTSNEKLRKYCSSELQIENPEFIQNKRLGFSVYRIPKTLSWYEIRGNDVVVPFGCLRDIYSLFPLHPDYNDYILEYKKPNKIEYKSNIQLYDYQKKAKDEAVKARNGVIVMPAGSGKTQTALQLICELGLKTLWLTHTYDLLNQSYDRAENNIDNIGLGKIAAGKIEIGTHITFATVQTLSKMDLSQYKNEWDCVIVDEGHRICGTPAQLGMFYKVINSLSCRYKYALTATPFRNIKGTEKALFALIGNIICEVPKEVVTHSTIKAKIQPILTSFEIPESCMKYDGTINYTTLTTCLSEDENRNNLISNILQGSINNYTLVLGDRLNQLYELQQKLGYGVVIDGKMTSKKAKAQREQYIQDVRDGKEHLLFATYRIS